MLTFATLADINADLQPVFISRLADAIELKEAHALAVSRQHTMRSDATDKRDRLTERAKHQALAATIRTKMVRAFERIGVNVTKAVVSPTFMTEATAAAAEVIKARRAENLDRLRNVRAARQKEADLEAELAMMGLV